MTPMEDISLIVVRSPVGSIADALARVEAAIVRRDVARRGGEDAASIERDAALMACSVLDGGIEYLDDELRRLEDEARRHLASVTPATGTVLSHALMIAQNVTGVAAEADQTGVTVSPTHEVEKTLLQLAGVSEALADRHVRTAFDVYRAASGQIDSHDNEEFHAAVMQRISRGRDAVCRYADELLAAERREEEQLRSRARMRRVSRVLAGALIAGTNATAGLILGPIAAAASAVVGGVAADVVNMKLDAR